LDKTSEHFSVKASIFEAYVEGPSAEFKAKASSLYYTPIAAAETMAEASLFKTGVKAGPAIAEVNLNLDTGASVSLTHASAHFLGFGFSIGSETSISTPFGKLGFKY